MLRLSAALAAACALVVSVGACGDNGSESTSGASPAPGAREFPAANGRKLEDILAEARGAADLVVSPAGQTYEKGRNRFSFGVFALDRSQIADAEVALYAAPGPEGDAAGPFPARIESLETDPAFYSRTTAAESQPVTVAYVSEMTFDRLGEWRLLALVKQGDGLVAARLPSIEVGPYPRIPDPGEMPPRIHTPTVEDVPSIEEIDTRIPPDTMHEHDLYEVIEERPVVLLFATPSLCMSRVCGPMVDIAEQVHAETGDDVAFIHVEVYNDNDPNKGIRPELLAFGLQTEPWLFVLDSSGRVSTRIEGAFSVDELSAAVERVTPGA